VINLLISFMWLACFFVIGPPPPGGHPYPLSAHARR
jgi:hypothetical protein